MKFQTFIILLQMLLLHPTNQLATGAQFRQTVRQRTGESLCAIRPPPCQTLRVRSRIQCSAKCDQLCTNPATCSFNYREDSHECMLFIDVVPIYCYAVVTGCTHYQVYKSVCSRNICTNHHIIILITLRYYINSIYIVS